MDGTRPGPGTLLLSGGEIAQLMTPLDYFEAVEAAFVAGAQGLGVAPAPLHLPAAAGGFHVKAAAFPAGHVGPRAYAAFKVNGNFPGNAERHGLPTIQGVIVLANADDGRVLALMDSIEITLQRTAAASAVAANQLAAADATRIAVLGCGAQAWPQLVALSRVRPLASGAAWDRDMGRAEALCTRAAALLGLTLTPASDLAAAAADADVIVTCTTAREPFLGPEHVRSGAFVAAVGADAPDKSELRPELLVAATVVVDSRAQARAMGDLRHAIAAGGLADAAPAELGEVLLGRRAGRTRSEEIVVFDSTGVAVQDVASAARAYERAVANGVGAAVHLTEVRP